MLFAGYPRDLVIALSHPRTGIAGEQTFMPSVAELRASLDRRVEAGAAEERREREREEFLRLTVAVSVPATPEQREQAVAYYFRQVRPGLASGGARNTVLESPEDALQSVLDRAKAEPLPALSEEAKARRDACG